MLPNFHLMLYRRETKNASGACEHRIAACRARAELSTREQVSHDYQPRFRDAFSRKDVTRRHVRYHVYYIRW